MYSEKIVLQNLYLLESKLGRKFQRLSVPESDQFSSEMLKKCDETGKFVSPLSAEEKDRIFSERVLSKFDFRYWALRYARILRDSVDGGGIGHISFWKSQEMALSAISRIEESMMEAKSRGDPVDGVCVCFHKARQLGATMLARLLMMHRLTNWSHHRAMSASVDEDKIMELYDRDKRILDNLPPFLAPSIGYDVKNQHIHFDRLDSSVLYQQSQQKSGLGQGRQFELAHLTECASWPFPRMIEFDFFPTLPQGIHTLCILESTANGRGNWWHEFTEEVRKGLHRRWHYIFTPWYIEDKKYRAAPPSDWKPSDITLAHAKKVYETSHEFVGKSVLLPKEQLYWYESERESALRRGSLNLFLTNYCATPEESFQHTTLSQFSVEVLERVRLSCTDPIFYRFENARAS